MAKGILDLPYYVQGELLDFYVHKAYGLESLKSLVIVLDFRQLLMLLLLRGKRFSYGSVVWGAHRAVDLRLALGATLHRRIVVQVLKLLLIKGHDVKFLMLELHDFAEVSKISLLPWGSELFWMLGYSGLLSLNELSE